jgi:hypothetical protein
MAWQSRRSAMALLLVVCGVLGVWAHRAQAAPKTKAVGAPSQLIFVFTNKAGRRVYVNDPARVPPAYRAAAREVDLSQISTNQKLGQQLAEAIEAERQLLFASEPCRGARERKETGFFQLLWRRHGHLVLLGGAALALLFFTPLMMRRIGPSAWGRILTFTLPVLAMLAFWTTAVVKTNRAREALVAAQRLCSPQHHPRARDSKGLRKQVDLLGQLRRYVSSARVIRR